MAGLVQERTLFVTGGFLLAYALRDSYDGSMVLSDGSEKMILGINLGLFAYSLAIVLATMAYCSTAAKRYSHRQEKAPHERGFFITLRTQSSR